MRADPAKFAILHMALIGFGLFTLSAAHALEATEVAAVIEGKLLPAAMRFMVPDAKTSGEGLVETNEPQTPADELKPVEMAGAPAPAAGVKLIDDSKLPPVVIYMLAAKLQLPLNSEKPPITVSISENGKVYVQENEIPLEEVVPKLQAIAGAGYDDRIYVRGDKIADYGTVMKVLARISTGGYKNVGLVTLQEQDQ